MLSLCSAVTSVANSLHKAHVKFTISERACYIYCYIHTYISSAQTNIIERY